MNQIVKTSDWYENWHACLEHIKHVIQRWNFQNINLLTNY